MRTRSTSCLRLAGTIGVLALLGVFIAPAGASAAGTPHWRISLRSFPTTFVRGMAPDETATSIFSVPSYSAIISNVGGSASTGPVTVTATLPAGVTVVPSIPPQLGPTPKSCVTPSPQEVVCEVENLASGTTLSVPVEVSETAPTSATSRVEVSGGGAPPAATTFTNTVGGPPPGFGFLSGPQGLYGGAFDANGLDASLAGSHPYSVTLESNFATTATGPLPHPVESLKNFDIQLPRGMVLNPQAPTVRCTEAELSSVSSVSAGIGGCSPASQVGTVGVDTVSSGILPIGASLYAMQPPPGVAAEFGFNLLHTLVHIEGGLDGHFHLVGGSSDILAKYAVLGIKIEFWGNPADPGHDNSRHGSGGCGEGCSLSPSEANRSPLLSMPTSCGEALTLDASALSWEGSSAAVDTTFSGADGPLVTAGCNALSFEPTIQSKVTTTAAESPSGLEFSIHQPQNEAVESRSTAALKNVQVTLPEGVTLNPSVANGLVPCTEDQMGYAPEGPKVQFSTTPQSCPAASKVGTLEVNTPLVDHELQGAVYVAKPFANPFNSLVAIYLAVEDEETGIVAKLAGEVEPDPQTGQLTATFNENPELPLEDIELHFFAGEHGSLTTPLTCGQHATSTTLTPWTTPEGLDVHPTDSFQTSTGCPASEAAAPKTVSFTAGTRSPLSGAYSPFVLRLARPDGSQHITGIETTLPEGLLGKLAGVAYCPESGIAQAISREKPEQGKTEQQSPSCPSSSEVGTVQVTAGSGITPIPVSGHAYLAGPYKGAPISLVVIVPAVAGPFDLGTVVDRVALNVGEYDARIHAVSDPLPTIRDGIPLDVRSIELKLDRPSFTLNPTSCEAMAIEGSVSTQAGQSANLNNRFQVGECGRLAFKPKIAISLKGPTKRTGLPALKATVTYPQGGAYANIARAQVSLPSSEFLEQGNIGLACTKPVLQAHACPARSIYGTARAWSPLLEKPLEGPVYLVGGYGYKLPAMVAELDGQIRVLLVGKVDTGSNKGIRNTFEAVPDAPVEKFVLELKGGRKYGLLVNSEDICKKKQVGQASFTAQNGRTLTLKPVISNSCKGKKRRGKRGKHGKRGT